MLRCLFLSIALFCVAVPAEAGEADVLDVKVEALGNGKFRFDVTVEHHDDGWDHYANAWQVIGPDGGITQANRSVSISTALPSTRCPSPRAA